MKLPIWESAEERKKNANMTRFIGFINERYGRKFDSYDQLYDWSITNLADFWASVWEFAEN